MDAEKGKTRKESTEIKVWVTSEEKAAIAGKADAHSLSSSGLPSASPTSLPLERPLIRVPMSTCSKSTSISGDWLESAFSPPKRSDAFQAEI
jgi:hypothetical protein